MSVVAEEFLAPNSYYDKHFKTQAVKILPGEFYVTTENKMIVTVLGSCVSVCLRDPVTRIAGMNHFLLPANRDLNGVGAESARYGVYAMEVLINHMIKLGVPKERLEAKVFGGGNVLKQLTGSNVGEQNAAFVLDYLKTENLSIKAKDLLGEFPRKVYFFPISGEVKVRKLKAMHNTTIIDRESEYRVRINQQPASGDVDLFE